MIDDSNIDVSDKELVISQLNKMYPDKVLANFAKEHQSLYSRLKRYLNKFKNIEIGDFLRDNGFIYDERYTIPEDETVEHVLYSVKNKFGTDIEDTRDLHTMERRLYRAVRRFANMQNITPTAFLKANGFNIKSERGPTNKYDIEILKELSKLYDFVQAEFANALDVSRENISKKIRDKKVTSNIWIRDKLTSNERKIVFDLCKRKENAFIGEDTQFLRIYSLKREFKGESTKYSILTIDNNDIIKYTKDLDNDIIALLDNNGYDKYNNKDFEVLRYMYNNPNSYNIQNEDIYITDTKLKNKLMAGRKKCDKNIGGFVKYVKYLTGYNYRAVEKSKEPIERIQEKTLAAYINTLKAHYIIEGNKVFILQNDPLRNRLQGFAFNHRDMFNGLAELLKYMGFEWVPARKLPDWYTPYEYDEKSNLDSENCDDDEFIANLKSIQGTAEVRSIKTEKVTRNRRLIDELKKRYKYKCQFCNYDEEGRYIPLIKTSNDTNYMEGHHIIKLSKAKQICPEDIDIETLDTYKNAIICCPHHHRYIHYYNNSEFNELVRDSNNKLYLRNDNGDLLEIYTNHHLDIKEAILIK